MSAALLEISNVTAGYGNIPVLHGVNLDISKGEIVTLIGCNGAGKSTTLRAISGLVRCSGGSVTFENETVSRLPAHLIVRRGLVQAPPPDGSASPPPSQPLASLLERLTSPDAAQRPQSLDEVAVILDAEIAQQTRALA